jgi:hypothetical protein
VDIDFLLHVFAVASQQVTYRGPRQRELWSPRGFAIVTE